MAAFVTALVALLQALPAVERLVRQALAERDKANERAAQDRRTAKDAAVDAAIDAPFHDQGEPGPGH